MKKTILITLSALVVLSIWLVFDRSCDIVDGSGHVYISQCLPDGFIPNLVPLSERASYLKTPKLLSIQAASAVERLITDAEGDGMCLVVIGAYRSFDTQQEIYNSAPDKTTVALPGRSEHQTGLAVDFSGCPMTNGHRDDSADRIELSGPFDSLPEYNWLLMHADYYGFEQSYRLDNVSKTGYPVEEWHWIFLGDNTDLNSIKN